MKTAAARVKNYFVNVFRAVRGSSIDEQMIFRIIDRLREQYADELREIVRAEEKTTLACRALMDDVYDTTSYLCNFQSAVDNNGEECEIIEVQERLQDLMSREYRRLTGEIYTPRSLRMIGRLNPEACQ